MSDFSPLWISIKTSITATFIVFFIGIATAWFMASYKGRNQGIIDGILTLPMVLPPTVVGFILLMIIGKNFPTGKIIKWIWNYINIHMVCYSYSCNCSFLSSNV